MEPTALQITWFLLFGVLLIGYAILDGVDLGVGEGTGEAFGCDLTEQYVIENSEYST